MKIALKTAWLAGVTFGLVLAGLVPLLSGSDGDGYNLPVHNLHSGKSFDSIQAAISDSDTQDGHVLSVIPGTYSENVEITKVLTVRSASGNPRDTVVRAKNSGVPVIRLMLNGITLSGFGIEGASAAAGIQVYTSEKCRVLNCEIKNNYHGIFIKHGSKNHFEGNTVAGNKIHGFYVASSRSNTFTGNFAESNGNPGRGHGFYLYFSDRCLLDRNTSSKNNGCGICLHEANDNVLKNNLIESNTNFGIRLSKSSNTTLTGNTLSGNEANFDVLGDTLAHYTHHVSESNTSDGESIHYEVIVPVEMAEGASAGEHASARNTARGKKSIGKGAGILIASSKAISRRKGGVITFSLKGGSANRTKRYLILGSLSGTDPGIPLPGEKAILPLRWDAFTSFIVTFMNTQAFTGFTGELDFRGNASAVFRTMGPLPPDMVGLAFSFAYALHDQGWDLVSYPVDIKIKP